MKKTRLTLPLLVALLVGAAMPAAAQSQAPASEQVIVPEVDRRQVTVPRFPSNDFEAGIFYGTYATQNFGTSPVTGLRVGYHVTEDVFVEAVYAQTKVSDELFRQILPGGVITDEGAKLKYYNLSAGVNVIPGEAFFGKDVAKASAAYVIGGIGSTNFNKQRRQTINLGFGMRLFLKDWAAVQVDLRDHIFSLDLLGKRQSTRNLEITSAITFFF